MAANPIDILSLHLPAFIVAIGFHEFCHAFAADRQGDPTPREQGRVTLNPIEHLDPIGTVLPMYLSLMGSPVAFGWGKPVEYDPRHFKDPQRGSGIVAFAGPLGNLFLCLVIGIILQIAPESPGLLKAATTPAGNYFYRLLFRIFAMNLGLFLFNLLPVPPLDGSKVVAWLGGSQGRDFMKMIQPYSFLILMVILFTNLDNLIITPLFIKLTMLFTGKFAFYIFDPARFIADFL